MNKYAHILQLLNEKKAIFKQAQVISDQLYTINDPDEFTRQLSDYQKYFDQATKINQQIKEQAASDQTLLELLNCDSDVQSLTDEQKTVYEASLSNRVVVKKLLQNDELIKNHFEYLKLSIMNKIEQKNTGGNALVKRYHGAVTGTTSDNFRRNKNKWV